MADPVTVVTGLVTALTSVSSYKQTMKAAKRREEAKKDPVDVGNPNDARNRAAAQRRSLDRSKDSETRLSTFMSNSSGGLG